MSVPPKFTPPISGKLTPEQVAIHLRQLYLTVNQHDQAIIQVHNEIPTTTATTTTPSGSSTTVTAGVSSFNSEAGVITYFPNLAQINNQSGNTAYTVLSNDSGQVIVFNSGSAIALTLDSTVAIPWFSYISNQGTGTITLTPTTGLINGGSSLAIPGGGSGTVFFDGANWECLGLTGASGVISFNGSVGAVTYFPNLGRVNNQSGNTVYSLVGADNGKLVVLNSGSAIAVTLNTSIATVPYFTFLANIGSSTVTLTPSLGRTVNGSASVAITGAGIAEVFFDGTNWWAGLSGSGTSTPAFSTDPLVISAPNGGTTYALPISASNPTSSFYFVNGIKMVYGSFYTISPANQLNIIGTPLPNAPDTHELYCT